MRRSSGSVIGGAFQEVPRGLTAVDGILVGHDTLAEGATGCTVVIAMGGATDGGDVRGGAPGSVETDLLDPVNSVDCVNPPPSGGPEPEP